MCLSGALTSMKYHYVLTLISVSRMTVFCSKLGMEVEYAIKSGSNLKIKLFQIWVICHLLPFVRVGQSSTINRSTVQTVMQRKLNFSG